MKRNMLLLALILSTVSFGQYTDAKKNYIDTYKDLAIQEMQRTGVPASITLAQGIHESGAGQSALVLASNNHFGIKCKSNWTGESVKHDDDARRECFRKYTSAGDSYKDHSDFLKNSPRYTFLFSLDPADYQGWANGLKRAGYATNPKYPEILIKLIEDYHLQDYTRVALGKMPVDGTSSENKYDQIPGKSTPGISSAKAVPDLASAEVNQPKAYPDGVFKINEIKVVYVKKGTSYLAVARQYDIDLAKLFEFNEIPRSEEAAKDQLVYLQRKRKTGNNKFHIVLPGETLQDIAQEEAIRMESLLELNWLKADMQPAIGEQLSLQSQSAVIPKLVIKENYSLIPVIKNKQTN